VEGRIQ